MADPATGKWLASLTPRARSLAHLYREGTRRIESYEAIVEEILARVRDGLKVCAAFYGHPGLFVYSSHEAVRRARAEGFAATMLPAISAADCLFADLGVDPGRTGWQSYEATDFVLYGRRLDPSAALVLWQAGGLGDLGYPPREATRERRRVLVEALCRWYPPEHQVVLYEASPYAVLPPAIHRLPLKELESTVISPLATLYVPPARAPERDVSAARRLGL